MQKCAAHDKSHVTASVNYQIAIIDVNSAATARALLLRSRDKLLEVISQQLLKIGS